MIQKKIYSFGYSSIIIVSLIILMACSKTIDNNQVFQPIQEMAQTTSINFIGHWLNEGERELFTRNIARVYEFENQHIKVNLKFPEEVFYDQTDRTSNERFTARVVEENITDWDIIRINSEYREVYQLLDDPDWAKKALVDFSTPAALRHIQKSNFMSTSFNMDIYFCKKR